MSYLKRLKRAWKRTGDQPRKLNLLKRLVIAVQMARRGEG